MDARQERAKRIEEGKFRNLIEQLRCLDVDERNEQMNELSLKITSSFQETLQHRSLAQSECPIVNECSTVFSQLLSEADSLQIEARKKYFNALLLYGEDGEHLLEKDDGKLRMMTSFFPFLCRLSLFIGRCDAIVRNILAQLHGFFNMSPKQLQKSSDRMMTRIWRCVGDVLSILLVFDEILRTHPLLSQHWLVYQRSINVVQHNHALFGVVRDDRRLANLENIVESLTNTVMAGNILITSCRKSISSSIIADRAFINRFEKIIFELLSTWDRSASEGRPEKQRLLSIFCLAILYSNILGGNLERRMVRSLFDTHKRIVSFQIIGDQLFTPTEMLFRIIPNIGKTLDNKILTAISQAKASLIEKQMETLTKDAQLSRTAFTEWSLAMQQEEWQTGKASNVELITERGSLILKGAYLADKLNRLLSCVLNGNRTISRSNVKHILSMILLIQKISQTFNKNWALLLEWASHCCADALRILETHRASLPIQATIAPISASILNAEYSLCEAISKNRLIFCIVSLDIANYKKLFRTSDLAKLDQSFNFLSSFLNIEELVARVTNFSFLYWHRISLTQVYLESIFDNQPFDPDDLMLFLRSINDCSKILSAVEHCRTSEMLRKFSMEMYAVLKENLLDRICTEIENDLRMTTCNSFQSVSVEELDDYCALRTNQLSIDPSDLRSFMLMKLLQLPDILIGNVTINIKDYVANKLGKEFYNLTAVAPHDHIIYVQMRVLAAYRYQITIDNCNFPQKTLGHGLGLLDVGRDLEIFATNYSYNMNEQVFVETKESYHSPNVFGVPQIISSLKTHDLGILNSLLNMIYQFLKKEFNALSLYLFDDQIKSQLIKEIHYYKDTIEELNQMYPMRRAERFIRNIRKRKLSAEENETFFLDKFRSSITKIGNIIGLVRLIRSGAIESSSEAAEFLFDEERIKNMFEQSKPFNDEQIKKDSEVLCSMSKVIGNTFKSTNNYIEILSTVFTKELRNLEKFSHLHHFFMIVPALTINYIDHLLIFRNRFGKKNVATSESDTAIVDDGFAIGLAYLLNLLNQSYFFDSMNWFDAVFSRYQMDTQKLEKEQKEADRLKDSSLLQSLNIKIGRLKELRREFKYLLHTFESAHIFFKAREIDDKEDENYIEEF